MIEGIKQNPSLCPEERLELGITRLQPQAIPASAHSPKRIYKITGVPVISDSFGDLEKTICAFIPVKHGSPESPYPRASFIHYLIFKNNQGTVIQSVEHVYGATLRRCGTVVFCSFPDGSYAQINCYDHEMHYSMELYDPETDGLLQFEFAEAPSLSFEPVTGLLLKVYGVTGVEMHDRMTFMQHFVLDVTGRKPIHGSRMGWRIKN